MLHTWPLVHVCEFECVRGTDVVVACTVREGAETLDDKFYRDLIMNFIIAGRDTTANALSWCIYTITTHPAVETKVGSVCMCMRVFVWSLSVECGWCVADLGAMTSRCVVLCGARRRQILEELHDLGAMDFETAGRAVYLRAVIQETLR